MECPICGSSEAWIRGKERSRQEGRWVKTTLECRHCGTNAEVILDLDSRGQRVLMPTDMQVNKLFG